MSKPGAGSSLAGVALLASTVPAVAQNTPTEPERYVYWPHMMGWEGGWYSGGSIMMLVWLGITVAVIVLLLRAFTGPGRGTVTHHATPAVPRWTSSRRGLRAARSTRPSLKTNAAFWATRASDCGSPRCRDLRRRTTRGSPYAKCVRTAHNCGSRQSHDWLFASSTKLTSMARQRQATANGSESTRGDRSARLRVT